MPSLLTGTPVGNVITQEDLYLEGAPVIIIQDYNATLLKNPDANGYYWGLSGTSTYPAKIIGCVEDVSLTEGLTMNDVRCDTDGVKDTVQRRDYVDFVLTIKSLFPLSVSADFLNLSTATVATDVEYVGIGPINNNKSYHVYAPKVYDEETGDLLIFNLHKAKFVDAWTIEMRYGDNWAITGVKLRAYADTTKPSGQKFGVIVRQDPSVL
jgi:hypothetical protein